MRAPGVLALLVLGGCGTQAAEPPTPAPAPATPVVVAAPPPDAMLPVAGPPAPTPAQAAEAAAQKQAAQTATLLAELSSTDGAGGVLITDPDGTAPDGWGTIGTVRGTSGFGNGVGTLRPRGTLPRVDVGQAQATGDLDQAIIRRFIRRNIQKLQYCYEKQLLVKPRLAGTVVAEFTIDGAGSVIASTASGVDPEVSSCVARVIGGITFPEPRNGGVVTVKYPFRFDLVAP